MQFTDDEKAIIRYTLGISGPTLKPQGTTALFQQTVANANTPVNHDTGGLDALRLAPSTLFGDGEGGVVVYPTAAYAAGNRDDTAVIGRALLGDDGRWLSPVHLPSGDYTLVFFKLGGTGSHIVNLTVA